MKKYLLIMLLLFPIKINAEILLTNYYLKESNIKEYKEETDYLKRTEIIKYNNYYTDRIDLGYHKLDEENDNYDLNDYIEKTSYIITKNNNYITNGILKNIKVKYLRLDNFNNNILESIKFFKDNEEIKFNYVQTNYIIGNKLTSNTAFTVELDELINLESLSINLTFKDNKTDKITFNLGIYNELNYAWNIEPDIIQINTNYNDKLNLNFLNQNKYQELLNNLNSSNLNNNISYSIVTEKLYRLYEPVKVYLSNYTEKPLPNCIHDLNDYKKYYTYYERYYIEIKDDVTSNENIILNTNIPLNEIEVITKEDFIILKYKHDTFYKKINKPKEENNSKHIIKVVNKQPTTKKNYYIPSTTKEVITTTKNTIQDQLKEKHISYIYLLLIPILIILYIFIRKNKI